MPVRLLAPVRRLLAVRPAVLVITGALCLVGGPVLGRTAVAQGASGQATTGQPATGHGVPGQSVPRVAGQIGSGVLLGPVGYVGGGLATRWVVRRLGGSVGTASTAAERAAYVGTAVATAAGPALIGARGPGHGNYFAALGGATVGMFGTALVARLNRTPDDQPLPPCRLVCRLSGVAAVLLPSVGATVGYNLSRRR